jgi:methyl-accepting chemotaxis protein
MGTSAEELRSEIADQRAELTRDFEMIGDKVSPSRMVERRTEAVKGRFNRMRDAVMGAADDVGSSAHGTASSAAGQITGAPHQIAEGARGNPLAAGMVAFGLGLLVATVLPPSRRERELARQVQPQLEHAVQAAAESGRDVAQELKPVVQDAASEMGDVVKDAADEVRHTAQDSASSVADRAQGAAQQQGQGTGS